MNPFRRRRMLFLSTAVAATILSAAAGALLAVCGPFTDVTDATFCPFVLEIFYLGITTGTSPTTYDPNSSVTRLQMAAFLSRTVDRTLQRGSRRAALDQFWTTQNSTVVGLTTVGSFPELLKSDGADIWVANAGSGGTVSRVRASDARLLETWTGAGGAFGVLVAMDRVLVTGVNNLYMIDPGQPAGAVTTVASNLGSNAVGIAFDGARVWTANNGGSISIVTPGASIPWTVTTVTTGFSQPRGVLYDGANIWVTDYFAGTLLKLDSSGAILQTVTVQANPLFPAFDGTNIWVPNNGFSTVSVVRASTGAVLQNLNGNGLNGPNAAAFDGQRVLVTNDSGDHVSLFKAADLTPIGSIPTPAGGQPNGACSDGVNFWTTLRVSNKLARF